MRNLFKDIKNHINKLDKKNKFSDLFVSDLEELNEKLIDGVSAHHPFRGVDKAKHVIQINNNPNYEYMYYDGNWYTSPHKKRKFESIDALAEDINKSFN